MSVTAGPRDDVARQRGSGGTPPATARVRGPRWRDPRLLVGVVLVLVSVAVGGRLYASADNTTQVWAAAHDLDEGSVIHADDVVLRGVQLGDVKPRYLAASTHPTGYVVVRAVRKGELLPSGAVVRPGEVAQRRQVTVPVRRDHLPPGLQPGRRVDVYATAKPSGGDRPRPELVVSGAVVAAVDDSGSRLGSTGADVGVVLSVPPSVVPRLIGGIRTGDVDLVRVPLGATSTASPSASPSP